MSATTVRLNPKYLVSLLQVWRPVIVHNPASSKVNGEAGRGGKKGKQPKQAACDRKGRKPTKGKKKITAKALEEAFCSGGETEKEEKVLHAEHQVTGKRRRRRHSRQENAGLLLWGVTTSPFPRLCYTTRPFPAVVIGPNSRDNRPEVLHLIAAFGS